MSIVGLFFLLRCCTIFYQAPGIVFSRDRFNGVNATRLETLSPASVDDLTKTLRTHSTHRIFHCNTVCVAQAEASALHCEEIVVVTSGLNVNVLVINRVK
jgi:hypothetical protein